MAGSVPTAFSMPRSSQILRFLNSVMDGYVRSVNTYRAFADDGVREKRPGTEVCRMNPRDAVARGLAAGDMVRLFIDRGVYLDVLQRGLYWRLFCMGETL